MRTRNKSTRQTIDGPAYFDRYNGGSLLGRYGNYPLSYEVMLNEETMTDDDDPNKSGFKDCLHIKETGLVHNRSGFTRLLNPAFGTFDIMSQDYLHKTAIMFNVGSLTPNAFAPDWGYESERGWQRIRPQFKSAVSSVNFLYELREIKQLFQLWKRYKGKALELRARKGYRWLKNVAGGHLNWSFGWAPLISDVESSIQAMIKFNAKWNELLDEANKPKSWHYSRPIQPLTENTWYRDTGHTGHVFEVVDVEQPIIYHLTVRGRYAIPTELAGIPRKFLAYMDAFGLNANPGIVWEAIPYSFAVDWLFNVGEFVDSLKIDSLPIHVELSDACHSVKRDCIRTVTAVEPSLYWAGSSEPRLLYTFTYSSYERRVTALSGVVPLRSKIPSWGQVALATSLAISKSRWVKPKSLARLRVPHRIFVPRRHTGR